MPAPHLERPNPGKPNGERGWAAAGSGQDHPASPDRMNESPDGVRSVDTGGAIDAFPLVGAFQGQAVGGLVAVAPVVGVAPPPGVFASRLRQEPAQQVEHPQDRQEGPDGGGRDAGWLAAGQERWSGRGRCRPSCGRRHRGRCRCLAGRRGQGGRRRSGRGRAASGRGHDAGRGYQHGRGRCRGGGGGGGWPGRGRWRARGGLGGVGGRACRPGGRAIDPGWRLGGGRSADGSLLWTRGGGGGRCGGRLPVADGGRCGGWCWRGWRGGQRGVGSLAWRLGLGQQGGRGHQGSQDRGGEPEDEQQQSPGPPWPGEVPRGWGWHGPSSWFGWLVRLIGCPSKTPTYRVHTT
jgi:hypothetical protein